MITLQFYENDGNARIFDKKEYMADLNRNVEGRPKLTRDKIDEILQRLNIERTEWKETDWGWTCKLNYE